MTETTLAPLSAWESFYVIVGSSAAALTGLQFVVIALIAEIRPRSNGSELSAWGTPTVVHFCIALLTSATLSAPWRTFTGVDTALGLTGIGGVAYVFVVLRRARRTTGYKPVLEDWIWHTVFPFLAYAAVVAGAFTMRAHTESALFFVAAGTLLLVFIGIHNAWDTVTFIATTRGVTEANSAPTPPVTDESSQTH
jgi:hypothetical protein